MGGRDLSAAKPKLEFLSKSFFFCERDREGDGESERTGDIGRIRRGEAEDEKAEDEEEEEEEEGGREERGGIAEGG